MRIDPLGESAAILRDLPLSPAAAAHLLGTVKGVKEAYAAFDTVGVIFDGEVSEHDLLTAFEGTETDRIGTSHRIPVLYDGEDLAEVAAHVGVSIRQVIDLHAGRAYDCRAVGFCPGFAYLAPLVEPLASLPRRASPRPRVAPGSVAIAAGMTAVYPLERPGGWWLVGRTPLVLVDLEEDFFPIQSGDTVTFVPIDEDEYARRRGERL